MIEHELMRDEGILIVMPQGKLASSDFEELAKQVDPYIEEKGGLVGLLIWTESFPGWDSFGALVSHLKFVREHHKKIKRIAAVTDSKFASIGPRIVDHFVSAEIKHFAFGEKDAALEWLKSSA
jgi:hypothetical protein